MRSALPLFALLALLAPGASLAQTCAGVPLHERPAAVSLGWASSDGVTGWGGGADVRVHGPLVASASVARYDYDGTDVNVWQAGGGVAWELSPGRVSVCPRAGLAYAWPDDDRFEIDAWTGSATLALGYALDLGAARAIPFVDAGLATTRASVGDVSDTSTDGVATFGATLAGSRVFGSVTLDVTTADELDPTWGVVAGVLLP